MNKPKKRNVKTEIYNRKTKDDAKPVKLLSQVKNKKQ